MLIRFTLQNQILCVTMPIAEATSAEITQAPLASTPYKSKLV
jgi:hypothetical protein